MYTKQNYNLGIGGTEGANIMNLYAFCSALAVPQGNSPTVFFKKNKKCGFFQR